MYKRSLRGWTPWGYSLIRGPIGTQGPTRSCSRGHPSVVEYFLQRDTWRRTSLQAALNQVPAISWHSGSKCDIGITGKERILVISNIFDMGQNSNFILHCPKTIEQFSYHICSSVSKGISPHTISYKRMPKLHTVAVGP